MQMMRLAKKQNAGAAFAIPFRTRVGARLKAGENTLEIVIENGIGPMSLCVAWKGTARRERK